MKIKLKFLLFLSGMIYLNGCVNLNPTVENIPKPINYSVLQKSAYFNRKNISFTIDSLNNVLYINLTTNALKDFPFPINKKYNDTLFKTEKHCGSGAFLLFVTRYEFSFLSVYTWNLFL